MGSFKSCRDCKPPKRHPGCHGECEAYLAEKAANDAALERIKAARNEQGAYLDYTHDRANRIQRSHGRKAT